MTKHDKSLQLFHLGYTADIRGRAVIVTTPEGRQYRVEEGRCSCPATTVCCHLLGLYDLLTWQAQALDVEAQGQVECDRNCWRFTDAGLRLATRARALSDLAGRLRCEWQVWAVEVGRAA